MESKPFFNAKVSQMKPKVSLPRGRRGRRKKLPITLTQEKETWARETLKEDGWERVATRTNILLTRRFFYRSNDNL